MTTYKYILFNPDGDMLGIYDSVKTASQYIYNYQNEYFNDAPEDFSEEEINRLGEFEEIMKNDNLTIINDWLIEEEPEFNPWGYGIGKIKYFPD